MTQTIDDILAESFSCLDRQVHDVAVKWLKKTGRDNHALDLSRLPRIMDSASWMSTWPTITRIASDLDAFGPLRPSQSGRDEAREDGWVRNHEDGRWAAEYDRIKAIGFIPHEPSKQVYPPDPAWREDLMDEESLGARSALYLIIRKCL